MDYEDSDIPLLPKSYARDVETRTRKLSGSRSINALIYGLLAGLVFSFLVARTGLIDDEGNVNFERLKSENQLSDVTGTKNLAEFLKGEVRVLCAVMTNSHKLNESGHIVMDTWGKRCNMILFFSEAKPERVLDNVIVLKETDGTQKVRAAFEYIHSHHLNDFDWIIKTESTAFLVLENLRHLLYQYDTNWPVAIGQRFLPDEFRGEYVISKKSLNLLVEEAFKDEKLCKSEGGYCDVEITKCMDNMKIVKVEGVDDNGRAQFFNDNPEKSLFPAKTDEYDTQYRFKLRQGLENCCSDRLVSLGNYWGAHLYYLEYFIYKVHAFGRHRRPEPLPKKRTLEQVIKDNE